MADIIEYIVRLKDELSGTLRTANSHAEKLNHTMSLTGEIAGGIKKAFFELFAIEKVIEFGKKSVEEFNEAAQASAQLDATLRSTKDAIGLTREQLDEQSESLSKHTLYTHDAITSMQSVLATFTAVRGEIAERATPAILDLSSKMKQDLQSSAVQVGKALNDPIKGIMALRRVGVSFTESQEKMIKTLELTGHHVQAQKMILAELEKEFGGSADAAAKAGTGPMQVFMHTLRDIGETIGGFIVGNMNKLTTAISSNWSKITEAWHRLMEFLKPLVEPIQHLFHTIVMNARIVIASFQQWSEPLGKIFTFLRNVLGWVIDALADVAGWLVKVFAGILDVAHTLYVLLEKIKVFTFLKLLFEGIWWAIKKIGDLIAWIYDHTLKPIFDAIGWVYDKIKGLLGISGSAISAANDAAANVSSPADQLPGAGPAGSGSGTGDMTVTPPSADKVSEKKPTNFYITIQKFGEVTIQSTTIREAASKVHDEMTKALLAAVNDFQIVANQ